MKHYFSHRRLQKSLQASRVPLNPDFVARLKSKLLLEAEKMHAVSRLEFNWNHMKRYSFAYLSFLLIIGLGIANFLPQGTLSAQELVSTATTNYESPSGTIYYEKRETTDYQIFPGEVSTEEVWSNDTGDLLWLLNKNNGGKLGSMIKINDVGVPIDYEYPAPAEISEAEQTMADSIKKGTVYCATIEVEGNTRDETLLQVAKENPAYWFISAGTGDATKSKGYGFIETSGSMSVKILLDTILSQMNQSNDISENNNYNLTERSEDEIQKYVLSQSWIDDLNHEQRTDYIFNAQNFTLERQEYYVDETLYSKTVYLGHGTYAASERDTIFDAEAKGLVENPNFTTVIPGYIQESGCYDNRTKLSVEESEAFLATLPKEAREGYKGTVRSVEILIPVNEEPSEEAEVSAFIWPTNSYKISQVFRGDHPGIDITREDDTSEELPEIYAAADGVVISVETGWNAGYGEAIKIDHGNGYVTHYTHLSEFTVEVGDTVTQGQFIGRMGNSGRVYGVTGIHMHFELIYNGVKVDPLDHISL
ncbi:M23 family metallopeptidase [Candidatus Peregrinibacteria bacterium]|nr:MAG: M23 family metallopeptidase [Candidatus Peregrinibacteria bacterium]